MTWLSTENAVDIRSFEEAQAHYENCEPIRSVNYASKDEDGVPLMSHRRDWAHKALYKLDEDTYGFRLYSTDVVRVHRDNSITIDLSYPSSTTDAWAQHWIFKLTGRYMSVWSHSNSLGMSWAAASDDQHMQYTINVPLSKQDDYAYFFTDTGKFRIERELGGKWFVHGCAPRYVKRVDKSAAYHKRKVLQPMVDYLKIYESMPMDEDTYRELQKEFADENGWQTTAAEKAIENPDDSSLWVYVAAQFHTNEWHYDWNNKTHKYNPKMANMVSIKKNLYQFLYDKEGINDFQKLALGESRHARLYTLSEVENYNG